MWAVPKLAHAVFASASRRQVLCWSVVEEHASTLTAVQAALDSELPRLLAEAEGQLGDLKREQAALTEAVEGKVRIQEAASRATSPAGGLGWGGRQLGGAAA